MEFRILGPVEVIGSDRAIRLGSRRERAVLAALVLGGGDVVSVDRLIDALWGDQPPRSAGKTLQNYVLRLRKALGPSVIETQAPGYRLAAEGAEIDARRFDVLVRSAGEARADGSHDQAAARIREALGLWRGVPLEELDGWPVAEAEATRLAEMRRAAAEELVDVEIACGRAAMVVAELETMVVDEPLRERRWAMLMLAFYRCGRQADALRTYQRARTLLGNELGIEPGPELRALEHSIAAQDPSLDLPATNGHIARNNLEAEIADDETEDDPNACPPYKGLVAFEPEDRALFFGRELLVAELVARAERSRFVAVVGASGSGKSSVVRAGVLPALREDGRPPGDPRPSLVMTPGPRPLAELASGLSRSLGCSTSDALDRLIADPGALAALAHERLEPGEHLLLVVDQLEELFTQTRDEVERRQFVATITRAVGEPDGPVTVLVAVRADFYGHCSAYPDLAAALDSGSTLLCPMEPDEIRAAVDRPAALAGLQVEAGLTELILRDVGDEPGALPLLSHALLETWKRRDRRTLTVAGYREAGGARGAIAQTAESVYQQLDPGQQQRARHVFLRLTQLGDGTEDTRRRVAREELVAAKDGPETDRVLRRLADARLVTLDESTAEVAHEALIREWPRLQAWLDEDRAGRQLHRHLTHAAHDWDALGREPSELYRGPRLAATSAWLARDDNANAINALEADFVAAERGTRAVRACRRARDRSTRVSGPTDSCGGSWSEHPWCSCSHCSPVRSRSSNAVAPITRPLPRGTRRRPRTSRASSRNPARSAARASRSPLCWPWSRTRSATMPQTQGAVLSAVVAEPRRLRTLPTGTSEGVWSMPAPSTVLVLSHGRLGIWDDRTGRQVVRLPVAKVESAAVRRVDGLVAAARTDGTVAFFTSTGSVAGREIHSHLRGSVATVAFSPDGRTLALAYGDWADPRLVDPGKTVRLYNVADRAPGPPVAGPLADVTSLAFSPTGERLALGGADDRVAFRDVLSGAATRAPIVVPAPAPAPVIGLAFDPVRDRIAIGSIEPGVDVVDLGTGVVTHLVDAPGVDVPAYDAAGDLLAVAGNGPVRLYDAKSLVPVPNEANPFFGLSIPTGEPLDVQNAQARVAFVADGRVVVGGLSAPATVWDRDAVSSLNRVIPGTSNYAFPMVGGKLVAVPDLADSVTLYSRRTLRPVGLPLTPGPGAKLPFPFPATFAASYYNGSRMAVVNRSGVLQLFDVASRRKLGAPIDLHIAPVYAVFSRDMHEIAVGGRQGEVLVIDLATHVVRSLESSMTNYVLGLEFGPHGRLVASDLGHVVVFSKIRSDHPKIRDVSRETGATGFGMDLSPDGRVLAVSAAGGSVGFYDARTLRREGPLVPASGNTINWIAFDRSGTKVVTGDIAGRARLVDVPSHQAIGPALGSNVAGGGSVFSHDGRTLGSFTFAGAELLSVDPAVWRREACRIAGRNLSADEWAKYLPNEGARRRTCPQYP